MSSQETFVSHLIELRTRLIHALVAVLIALVALLIWPGAAAIYDFLALPLMEALPQGTRMIATGVITPFLIPLKVTTLAAFMLALPYVLYQAWAFIAPGGYVDDAGDLRLQGFEGGENLWSICSIAKFHKHNMTYHFFISNL